MKSSLDTIRGLPGGGRVSEWMISAADIRNESAIAKVVRRLGGLPPRPIPTYWWSAERNFGDILSAVVVGHVSRGDPVLVSKRYQGKLLAAGSITHRLARGDWVWGAGSISDEPITPPPDVRFHAVRGPLTRRTLRAEVPEIYGDPITLLPRIYSVAQTKRYRVGIVPHLVDIPAVDVDDPSITKIDVRCDWQAVVDHIVACDVILSSSLHGLIVAEAYGIPAVWVTITGKVKGGGFKFRDYYLSTHREPTVPMPWAEVLRNESPYVRDPPSFDTEPLLDAWPEELTFGTLSEANG